MHMHERWLRFPREFRFKCVLIFKWQIKLQPTTSRKTFWLQKQCENWKTSQRVFLVCSVSQCHMTDSIWTNRYFLTWPTCTLKMTEHLLLHLKNHVSAVGLDRSPAPVNYPPTGWDTYLASLALLAPKVLLNITQILESLWNISKTIKVSMS